jgi:predicted kinase
MTDGSDHSATSATSLHAGLLIVTGASHTGKSSVIRSLLTNLEPPVALLGVDDLLAMTLVQPRGDRWAEIPLAYELIQRQIGLLLARGWFVVVETTFTYVPLKGEPTFHWETLEQMVRLAEQHGAAWFLCQVEAPLELALQRSARSGRLPRQVVAATVELHDSAEIPEPVLRLSSADRTPDELAQTLITEFSLPITRR